MTLFNKLGVLVGKTAKGTKNLLPKAKQMAKNVRFEFQEGYNSTKPEHTQLKKSIGVFHAE